MLFKLGGSRISRVRVNTLKGQSNTFDNKVQYTQTSRVEYRPVVTNAEGLRETI